MVPMKSMAMPSELLCETVEWQPRNKEEGGRAKNGEDETGDCYSITSVIPSPAENMQQPKSGDQPEEELVLQSPLVSPHTEDSLSNAGHRVSPLESIRELDEVDEQGSDLHRSPGDGAVKVREQVAGAGSLPSSVERNSGMGDSSGDRSSLSGAGLVPTFKSAVTRVQRAKLDGEMADLLKHPQGTSHDNLLQVESLNMQPEEKSEENSSCSGSRVCRKEKGHDSITEFSQPEKGARSEESLDKDLETSATSLQELQDLKLHHQSHQEEINHLCTELRDSKERIRELESILSTEGKKGENQAHEIPELESEMSNSSLIAVLTECQSKIEQLEEIKHSSLKFTVQLQAAQGLAASLQRRVLCLENERTLKQQQVLELTKELEATRRALQEKSAEVACLTAQLHVLQQLREKTRESGACSSDVLANGHTTVEQHRQPRQYSNDSKVCTLL
ncbi:paramyosin-like [Anguilla anguilla]|uniref:paramyosin-like n=1 Tax=Anguilla anguilla TaxID=7936 RepID=UPI0015AB538F|nr:paramyosin-like [Anguilla anguilla]